MNANQCTHPVEILVVEYIDDRNESRRTGIVTVPLGQYYLIPFRLRDAGREVKRVVSFYRQGHPENVVLWNSIR